jgi:predicted O-methyltransferase YrrM
VAAGEAGRRLPRAHTLELLEHVADSGAVVHEGFASPAQLEYFTRLIRRTPGIRSVAEIGFNAGVSAENFLAAHESVVVVSFDLARQPPVRPAKEYVDRVYPNRHHLVVGNSAETIPAYCAFHPEDVFDLIFVDGGHSYDEAWADLCNLRCAATLETVLVMDDLTPWHPWADGPCRAWDRALAEGIVVQDALLREGVPVQTRRGTGNQRIWAQGRYLGV